jgi:hypothetical protein
MKKIYLVIIAFILTCSISFGQMANDIESIIPAEVQIFFKTKEISKLTKTINYTVNNLMDAKQRAELLAKRDEFKNNTGIDYLDENSLRSAGIDTDRSVSIARFDKDNIHDVILLLIPVLNEGEAVLRFIEVLKKMSTDDSGFIGKPVTTKYKNLTVYELKKDMYVTAAYRYLIIGSTSEIIKKAIDFKAARNGTLILDADYKDYLSRMGDNYDLNVFVTKRFIKGMNHPFGNNGADETSFADAIDYISAGTGFDKNKFQINASIKFAKYNKITEQYLGFLKTGVHESSLYVPTADYITFFSLDYQYINNFCKGEVEWCAQFNSIKEQMRIETGIDWEKDFLPYFNGGVNIISQDDINLIMGGMGDFLVFTPMTDSAKIEELLNKIKKFFQGKYSKSKKFGEEKIGNSKGFWFISDESQMRFFVSYDKRGIYAGNSVVLMKSSLSANTVAATGKSERYKDIINDKTFSIFNIKKNSFVKMLMQMQVGKEGNIAGLINRFGEMFLFCEKNDNFISVNFEVEIKDSSRKK